MRINVDGKAMTDPRFSKAGLRLGINKFEVRGRCLHVWLQAYENRTPLMARDDIDALAEFDGFADAMVAASLARPSDEPPLLWLCGVTERIDFLLMQDAKRGKALAAKRAKAGLPGGRPGGLAGGRPYISDSYSYSDSSSGSDTSTSTPKGKPSRPHHHPESLRLAELLHSLIAVNLPNSTIAKESAADRNGTIATWADDIEKLNRIDGAEYAVIEEAIRFAQADERFWRSNVLSGKKVRKNFNTLEAQRTSRASNGSNDVRVGRVEPQGPEAYGDTGEQEI
jgi:hypothetical protein